MKTNYAPSSAKRFWLLPIFFFCLSPILAQPGGQFPYPSNPGMDTLYSGSQMIILNASKDTIEIAKIKNGLKNGKQTMFYNNGEISRIAHYKNDLLDGKVEYFSQGRKHPNKIEHYKAFPQENISRLHGKFQSFGANDQLMVLYHYKNGLKDGKFETYHNNGNLREKGNFKEELLSGRMLTYQADGTIQKDESYLVIPNPEFQKLNTSQDNQGELEIKTRSIPEKISVLHGKAVYYFSNGKPSAEYNFKHGKRDGLCREYHQDADHTLKMEAEFKDGLEHGAFIYYRATGNVDRKGIFYREIQVGDTLLKNVYDGTVEFYQDNGKRHRTENWKNYKKNGIQESFYYKTGELSERSHITDNLKEGIEERFDKEGNRTYQVLYEIVEKDGQKISQKTGTETYWENNQLLTVGEWKNGQLNGVHKAYYPNGQLKSRTSYVGGKSKGAYQTFYENGQLKEDGEQQPYIGTRNSEWVNWNTRYDEEGNITRKFFALGNGSNLVEHEFKNSKRTKLLVNNFLQLDFAEDHSLSSLRLLDRGRIGLGFSTFSTGQLRRIQFFVSGYPGLTANFTSDGIVNQMRDATGKIIEDPNVNEIVQKIASQYNSEWESDRLVSDEFPDGKYQWNYADNSLFLEIEFKDGLPDGKWFFHNPILQDTLFYTELEKGLPVGKLVRKTMDGVPQLQQVYYDNHELKESYRYNVNGILENLTQKNSQGEILFEEEFYPDGILKRRRDLVLDHHWDFSPKGDTLSVDKRKIGKDSVTIRKQFYEGNKIQVDRRWNHLTGEGYVKTYFENGQLKTSHELFDNKPHGEYKMFDEDGKLLRLGHFKNGVRDGQWIEYDENGQEEISYFKDGEIQITPPSEPSENENPCICHDLSLPGSQIGFAQSLDYFAEYYKIKPYIPPKIFPIDDFNYQKIYFIQLRTDGGRTSGYTHFKLLTSQELAFYFPREGYLKFNLNPCYVTGYLGNIQANFSYDYQVKALMYAQLQTKRISVSLENNPLVNAKDRGVFTAYFDTDLMNFDEKGLESIRFTDKDNDCFPLGSINQFMEVQIEVANLNIHPENNISAFGIPLFDNEIKQFYGLEIQHGFVRFKLGTSELEASVEKIWAGFNYVAGNIFMDGKMIDENEFSIDEGKVKIRLDDLKKTLEQNGFYRVKTEISENRLNLQFYAEK